MTQKKSGSYQTRTKERDSMSYLKKILEKNKTEKLIDLNEFTLFIAYNVGANNLDEAIEVKHLNKTPLFYPPPMQNKWEYKFKIISKPAPSIMGLGKAMYLTVVDCDGRIYKKGIPKHIFDHICWFLKANDSLREPDLDTALDKICGQYKEPKEQEEIKSRPASTPSFSSLKDLLDGKN